MPQNSFRQFRAARDQDLNIFASSTTTCGKPSITTTSEIRHCRLVDLATEANERPADLDPSRARRHTPYSSGTTKIAVRGTTAAQSSTRAAPGTNWRLNNGLSSTNAPAAPSSDEWKTVNVVYSCDAL
jgi:hypothetical protein